VEAPAKAAARPGHVRPDLVAPAYPFAGRGDTLSVLPRTLIPEIHKGPAVIWVDGAFGAGGAWVPRRYADLQQIYLDTEHFTTRGVSQFGALIGETWDQVPFEVEPPLHALHRLTLNPMLAPSRVALLEAKIRQYARERLEELKPRGGCEFVGDFAFEFPIRVFLELMGLPQERMAQFLAWEHGILRSRTLESVAAALRQVTDYLAEECEERRRNPKNDLLTLGVQAEIDGRKMTGDELKGFCFNLFVGGLDTVSTNMSAHFRHLAERPDHQRLLREHPEKIPDALEELMRAYASVMTLRLCKADTRLGDAEIKAGDILLMPTFLAANDPEAFPDPETVDFDRKPRHVSFGYGPHICIGMHLARREMRIALEEALSILPEFSIEPGAEIVSYCSGIIGPKELPLVWKL
jgi:cytochrome P450